jgi:hypothetical protein
LFGDLIDQLQAQLQVATRREAVHFYLDRNEAEVKLAMNKIRNSVNEVRLAILACRAESLIEMIKPLRQAVSTFVRDRIGRCLYDYLPIGLRSPENYDAMFMPVSAVAFPVQTGNVPGVIATFPAVPRLIEVLDNHQILLYQNTLLTFAYSGLSEKTRLIDIRSQCAVDMRDEYNTLRLLLTERVFLVYDKPSNEYLLWRADSVEPFRMEPAHHRNNYVSFELSNDGNHLDIVRLIAGDNILYKRTFPLDLSEPFIPALTPRIWMTNVRFPIFELVKFIQSGLTTIVLQENVYENLLSFLAAYNHLRARIILLPLTSPGTLTDQQKLILMGRQAVQERNYIEMLMLFQTLRLDPTEERVTSEYITWLENVID